MTRSEHLGSTTVFGEVCVAHLFNSLCCVVFFFFRLLFICLRHVLCVSDAAIVSGLSILDCSFGFFLTFITSSECDVYRVNYVCIVEGHSLIHQGLLVMYNDDDNGFIYNRGGVEPIYPISRTVGRA